MENHKHCKECGEVICKPDLNNCFYDSSNYHKNTIEWELELCYSCGEYIIDEKLKEI